MNKLNLGCGMDYKEGYSNIDFNPYVKADIYLNLNSILPYEDGCIDEILLDNSLEHISTENFFNFMKELHRVCKNGAIIKIYTPHFSSMYALKHLTHYRYFGIGTFDIFSKDKLFNGEKYSSIVFKTKKEKLLFFHHNLQRGKFLSMIPINFLFNFNRAWKLIMERFQFLGFDEIYYELEVIK